MIGIQRTINWYNSKAERLNYHASGMEAKRLIPVFENQILISETKQRAFGRHRILKRSAELEKLLGDIIKCKLVIVKAISKAYLG